MKKVKANLIYGICAIILAWMIVCWVNVVCHNGNKDYVYPRWNMFTWFSETETESYVVIDCEPIDDYYVVTIEDRNGNQWAYYDDRFLSNGHLVRPTFNGNEIVDIAY